MPYIKDYLRDVLKDGTTLPQTPGELNYCITEKIIEYVNTKGVSYDTINDIIGALEGAKLEFYRRVAAPYEDHKISVNGDVY